MIWVDDFRSLGFRNSIRFTKVLYKLVVMDFFDLSEAQFFRLLCRLFGAEQVIPKMSVYTVCGGKLPRMVDGLEGGDIQGWAKANQCLFTILDQDDNPRVVIELSDVELTAEERLIAGDRGASDYVDHHNLSNPFSKQPEQNTARSEGARQGRLPAGAIIDVNQLERQRFLPVFFSPLGIRYITLTVREISELLDPESHLDLVTCLADKFGLNLRGDA